MIAMFQEYFLTRKFPVFSLPLPALLILSLSPLVGAESNGRRWWSHVEYLADDKLEGRNTGSEGHRLAAVYVAGEFERTGLKPAGTSGYMQPVRFVSRQIDEKRSSLALVRGGRVEPMKLGDDATFSLRSDVVEALEAPAVFVGYGLKVPEMNYDDLAGLDLRGKIAVFLASGPASIPGPLRAHAQSSGERWKNLRAAGAVGVASILNPRATDVPWERSRLARHQPSMSLADPKLNDNAGLKLSLTINPAHADRLLAGSGHTFAEILAQMDAGKPLPRFPLAARFRTRLSFQRGEVESQNVIGVRPGSDPKLKDEYVVLSAHLDHNGVGAPIGGDAIYNGAMDDAAGVASLIEMARALNDSGARLKRSLLFVVVTGEEKGLQGSKYFAAYPTVKAANIVADLNLDMFLPLYPLRILTVYGLEESSLGAQVQQVAGELGVRVQSDPEPQRNIFIRSDQYSFIRRGVPAMCFKFGAEAGSREEQMQKEWLKQRYHAPSDDIRQPVDLDAADRFNQLILALAEHVANDARRPQWNKDSFFRRFGE